ncbi:hypothetical protein IWX49DRAFT_153382 [Phyllosticta citricarpa]|uniref:Uncharacterized protein n=1 Tax=Phyllosticta citricarpa TaxID=55181 RepID=A0ABR1MHY7_9PEZI
MDPCWAHGAPDGPRPGPCRLGKRGWVLYWPMTSRCGIPRSLRCSAAQRSRYLPCLLTAIFDRPTDRSTDPAARWFGRPAIHSSCMSPLSSSSSSSSSSSPSLLLSTPGLADLYLPTYLPTPPEKAACQFFECLLVFVKQFLPALCSRASRPLGLLAAVPVGPSASLLHTSRPLHTKTDCGACACHFSRCVVQCSPSVSLFIPLCPQEPAARHIPRVTQA